jgi:hypothetical protein
MTSSDPPRLAVALLHRFLDGNEPLAGDLLEGFAARQSRLWFWRQVLMAIAIRVFQDRDEECPLGLVGHDGFITAHRTRALEPRRINLTASPIPDVGGLGLLALGVLVAVVRPEALWIFLPAIVGGVSFGWTMAMVRRRAILSSPADGSRTLLRDFSDAGDIG